MTLKTGNISEPCKPGPVNPQELLQLDPAAAEERFNSISLERKVQVVLSAPWQKRRDIIMLADNAHELVRALPCDELYWTVRQLGAEESLQLISLTSHEQLQFLFDIECWHKDLLEEPSVLSWYKILSKCSELKVMDWFHNADEQFLLASLKKLVSIIKIQQDTDISEEYESMPAATLDGIYFFIFKEKDAYSTVMPLFNLLYANDRDLFYTLAEGIIWDTAPEVEESAYDWKKRRLAEYGFPEFEDSLDIYQLIPEAELHNMARADRSQGSDESPPASGLMPRYRLSGSDLPRFYGLTLAMIENPAAYEKVQRETIVLANKIIIADGLEVKSAEDTGMALKKAAGAIGITLEYLSGSDPASAKFILLANPAIELFRAGITLIMKLRTAYDNTDWHIGDELLQESFFGTPDGETLRGLTRKRPVFFEGCLTPGSMQYRAFADLRELHAAGEILCSCRELDGLLFAELRIDPAWLFSDFLAQTTCGDATELTASSLVMTIISRLLVSGEARLEALSDAEARAFVKKAYEQQPGGSYALKAAAEQTIRQWLISLFSCDVPQCLQDYISRLLKDFTESIYPIAGQKRIEKRSIDKLLFKKAE